MKNLFKNNCIGKLLKTLREDRKLSTAKLANMVGVNQNTVYKWENGEQNISGFHLLDVLYELDCTDSEVTNFFKQYCDSKLEGG